MPSKRKYPKNEAKPVNSHFKLNENNVSPVASTLSPELEQQFQIELCWCIQQLQTALKSGKLNNKQVQDYTKALNTLMNNSAPTIKKRQVMRLSFGDYRAKMALEEKKCSKSSINMKVKPATPNKISAFIKKSTCASSGHEFRFNFEEPHSDKFSNNTENINIESVNNQNEQFSFMPSDNSFRFSFNINEKS